jgi:putative transposase
MSQSLSKQIAHIIFHVKNTNPFIRNQDEEDLHAYIGAIIKDNDSIPILINGVTDHIHILCVQSDNFTTAKLDEEIKRPSLYKQN